ncbi:type II toxin-antitoxin system VapC family toxin [Desulfocapsa sp. AH-315-G09]|uniref:Type II toxin-antitoxin system VapC family toxin n=1 Tax=Desulfotalea psychrophila TaxID=84980 RepID=A0ABS3ASU4_9BACT|nr:type II toxin-antitoxin system VapC family toxin [Desulfocapsa sp.]MBN4052901.1 type II toxin-antitoxin system VapC family toxin [bacterium AH-315-K15]MBN4060063.1 type II toxin-antitoxin system VapC family toxin [Desulfotalea psychrophila]MBN4065537.1 type II toxin-antitoxin system VapC family toxin [Desulfocapsa sp. AH-315-G09]MBN4068188.1 type II toxin-antitoxin system VapC family toxin [Desulfotalea psychrophila]
MLLIDTHVLVWLDEANNRLGRVTKTVLDDALQAGSLAVASISFWEVATLVAKDRVSIGLELDVWRKELLQKGLCELPMHGGIAIRAGQLEDMRGDPADRIIVATALEESATLVTADRKILEWAGLPNKLDASR